MKGKVINNVAMNGTAGSYAWAIKNRVTQTIDRCGFGSLTAATPFNGYPIQPITVLQDHVLQSYTLAAGTTYLAWVKMHGRPAELFSGTIANGATGELTTVTDSSSLGSFADQRVEWIKVQGPDGKIVSYMQIFDANGGETFAALGGERESLGGIAPSGCENLCALGLNVPIMRGMAIKLTVAA
tara:strand:+ start:634 stop:1185 length:552 start_codon:yes stop_codon:yes gene_type:complete